MQNQVIFNPEERELQMIDVGRSWLMDWMIA